MGSFIDAALQHFLQRDWSAAVQGFSEVLDARPGDPAAMAMLDRARRFLRQPTGRVVDDQSTGP